MWYKKHETSLRERLISCSWLDRRLLNHHNGTSTSLTGPCDFWLNSYIKDRLVEQPHFEALSASITAILDSIPILKSEYLKTFQTWAERMKLCMKYEGNYFEHIT